jgi:predicted kinase
MAYHQPVCYVLIGPPGSGKSTWLAAHLAAATVPTEIIGTDYIIDTIAKKLKATYTDVFRAWDGPAIKLEMQNRFEAAVKNKHDIVIDRTNTTAKVRRGFLSRLPKKSHYRKVAVVFDTPVDVLYARLEAREIETGKHIPRSVVDQFIAGLELPQPQEFDQVITVTAR